jgi:hypothetical protein
MARKNPERVLAKLTNSWLCPGEMAKLWERRRERQLCISACCGLDDLSPLKPSGGETRRRNRRKLSVLIWRARKTYRDEIIPLHIVRARRRDERVGVGIAGTVPR